MMRRIRDFFQPCDFLRCSFGGALESAQIILLNFKHASGIWKNISLPLVWIELLIELHLIICSSALLNQGPP